MVKLMLIILLALVLFCVYYIAQTVIDHSRDKEQNDEDGKRFIKRKF